MVQAAISSRTKCVPLAAQLQVIFEGVMPPYRASGVTRQLNAIQPVAKCYDDAQHP